MKARAAHCHPRRIPPIRAAASCMRSNLAMRSAASATTRRSSRRTPTGRASSATRSARPSAFPPRPRARNVTDDGRNARSPTTSGISNAPQNRRFDVWHAQDGISGNALATLKERGLIAGFARTVHHVDTFEDERLSALQSARDHGGRRLFVVSRAVARLACPRVRPRSLHVGNGVDTDAFLADAGRDRRRRCARVSTCRPAPRCSSRSAASKNARTRFVCSQAFQILRLQYPASRLVIAGGASLLDHDAYRRVSPGCWRMAALSAAAVIRTGPLPQELMPALYRAADALVFPSIEGRLRPRRAGGDGERRAGRDLAHRAVHRISRRRRRRCGAIRSTRPRSRRPWPRSLDTPRRARLIARGSAVAARHDWANTARAHLPATQALREPAPCLKCASASAGPTAPPRPAIRRRW